MAEKVKACIQVRFYLSKVLCTRVIADIELHTIINSDLNTISFITIYSLKASKYLDENSRYEMLDVLTHLEGELQAKDVTIAALKVKLVFDKYLIYRININYEYMCLINKTAVFHFSPSVLNMSYTVFKLLTNLGIS